MKRGFVLLFFTVLLLACFVSATAIHGTVYDTNLNPVKDCVVEVDSEPKQRLIAKDGSYSFNLNVGSYELVAKCEGMVAKESVSIKDDAGDYVLDLFLFPSFEEEEELIDDTNLEVGNSFFDEPTYSAAFIIVVVAVLALAFFLFLKFKKKSKVEAKEVKKEHNELDSVVNFIKEEGGRVTQKDIRKRFPLSEAKISLMIAELEHNGIVEKIKKGRGNIIVLKK
ncbi:MAG: hypothetical protein QW404_02770 [Candidatus Nanoarchaeia archaeon]